MKQNHWIVFWCKYKDVVSFWILTYTIWDVEMLTQQLFLQSCFGCTALVDSWPRDPLTWRPYRKRTKRCCSCTSRTTNLSSWTWDSSTRRISSLSRTRSPVLTRRRRQMKRSRAVCHGPRPRTWWTGSPTSLWTKSARSRWVLTPPAQGHHIIKQRKVHCQCKMSVYVAL